MNKRGTDKIIAMYWFIILIIVAGGIFAMVNSFYNYPYDVREVEANIMINQIADCLSSKGNLNFELNEDLNLNQCHLNFDVEEIWDSSQYYLQIDFYKAENFEEPLFTIQEENKNLLASCSIQEEKEYKREVKCVEKEFFSFKGEELYLIKILSVIRKAEKNVK